MFKEPVEVLPNVNYTACATLKVGPALQHRACSGSPRAQAVGASLLGVTVLGHPDLTLPPTHLQGPDSHYGTKGLRKVTHESSTTGAKTCFTFCYAAGNNNGTSVEDGQIPEVIFYT